MHFSCHIVTLLRFATLSLFTLKSAELSEGRHVIAEKVERADELVGLRCSEHSFVDDDHMMMIYNMMKLLYVCHIK